MAPSIVVGSLPLNMVKAALVLAISKHGPALQMVMDLFDAIDGLPIDYQSFVDLVPAGSGAPPPAAPDALLPAHPAEADPAELPRPPSPRDPLPADLDDLCHPSDCAAAGLEVASIDGNTAKEIGSVACSSDLSDVDPGVVPHSKNKKLSATKCSDEVFHGVVDHGGAGPGYEFIASEAYPARFGGRAFLPHSPAFWFADVDAVSFQVSRRRAGKFQATHVKLADRLPMAAMAAGPDQPLVAQSLTDSARGASLRPHGAPRPAVAPGASRDALLAAVDGFRTYSSANWIKWKHYATQFQSAKKALRFIPTWRLQGFAALHDLNTDEINISADITCAKNLGEEPAITDTTDKNITLDVEAPCQDSAACSRQPGGPRPP